MDKDKDIIEKALDAAEEQLTKVEDSDSTEESKSIEEKLIAEKDSNESTLETSENVEEEQVEKKPTKKEEGRKRKGKPAEQELDLSGQDADVEKVEEENDVVESEPPIDPPMFWPAEKKAIFAKAPRELQAAFLEVDAQRNDWANRVARDAEKGKAIEKRANEVFEPYKLELQANGIEDPFQAVSRLLAWNKIFEKDPVEGILGLMKKNGITPEHLSQGSAYGKPEQSIDPYMEEVRREAEEARKTAEALRSEIEEQKTQVLKAQIEAFKTGLDSSGKSRRQFAELYAPQITNVVQAIQQANPEASLFESLNQAYEYVRAEVGKLHGIPDQKEKREAVVMQAKKAQNAASSVNGAPSKGISLVKPKAKTLDEALDMAEELVYSRS